MACKWLPYISPCPHAPRRLWSPVGAGGGTTTGVKGVGESPVPAGGAPSVGSFAGREASAPETPWQKGRPKKLQPAKGPEAGPQPPRIRQGARGRRGGEGGGRG